MGVLKKSIIWHVMWALPGVTPLNKSITIGGGYWKIYDHKKKIFVQQL